MTYIIPSLHFTGNGTIIRWRVGGVYFRGSKDEFEHPRLQIWRPMTSDPPRYVIAHEIMLLNSNGDTQSEITTNAYEYRFSTTNFVRVQSGDILGVFFTRRTGGSRTYLDVYFETSSSPVDYFRYNGEISEFDGSGSASMGMGLPLVALELICDGTSYYRRGHVIRLVQTSHVRALPLISNTLSFDV